MNDIKAQNDRMLRQAELKELPVIDYDRMMAIVDKWLILPDRFIVKLLLSCYCANELAAKPVWLGIIAPSGGGKTEILNAISALPKVTPISLITPNTFLSGMPGPRDTSLLPKVNGHILVFKDWTTILSMQRDARNEIFGQLREIFDGTLRKEFGNGQSRSFDGKVSIIFASTEAVDLHQQQYTHLGERFLYYRPLMPGRKEVARRSLENAGEQKIMEKELQDAVFSFMKGIDFTHFNALPDLPEDIKTHLIDLAYFTTFARSGVIRDMGPRKDVLFVPSAEMPTRILQQISLIAKGAMILNHGAFLADDMLMLYKVALDSIPKQNKMVIVEMAKAPQQTTAAIATALGYPTETIRTYLENLALHKVCKRIKESGNSDRWEMQAEFVDIIRTYEGIAPISAETVREREEEARGPDEVSADEAFEELSAGGI